MDGQTPAQNTAPAGSDASDADADAEQVRPGGLKGLIRRVYDPFAVDAGDPPTDPVEFMKWAYEGLKPALLVMIGCSLMVGLVEVAIIDGLGRLVDAAAQSGRAWFWSDASGLIIWVLALSLVLRPIAVLGQGAIASLIVNPSVGSGVIHRLHRHALGQSVSYFDNDFAGRLTQKELQTGQAVQTITVDAINAVGMLAAFLIGMTISLGLMSLWMLLALIVWAAAYAATLYFCLPRIRAAAKRRAGRRSVVGGQLVDSFANIKTVKLFAHAHREDDAARKALSRYRESSVDVGLEIMRLRVGLQIMNALLMAAAILGPLQLWLGGGADSAIGVGAVAASGMLAFRLTGMSNWIAFTLLSIFTEIGVLEDGVETLTKPHDITDPPEPTPTTEISDASIAFDAVRFAYGESQARRQDDPGPTDVAGLHEFSLRIAAGERVGLVGPSGAGKSTAAALLLRLYDVDAGSVKLGGVDVRALGQDDLRRQIAVVTQETALFNRSALDNIRYGRPDASFADVVAAAKLARAHEFIEGLRDFSGGEGYAAELGERGVRLSGGQRQRLALARAFLKDAPVLVLDEATSALDSDIEADVLEAMTRLMRGKTVLAIAHRLSTLAEMDRIAVMKDGRIIEQGAHDALLARGGLYTRLWTRQSGGFLPRRLEAGLDGAAAT